MDVLQRANNILASDINALLDKTEDPVKIVDQLLLNFRRDTVYMKQGIAAMLARERFAKQNLDKAQYDVDEYTNAIRGAESARNESAIKSLSGQKQIAEQLRDAYGANYDRACADTERVREACSKLSADIAVLERRKSSIRAESAAADALARIS